MVHGGKLKRHIIRKHKHNPDVSEILKQPTAIQQKFFELKRKEGIHEYNQDVITQDEPLMRERKSKLADRVRVCVHCNCYFSSIYFSKHKCLENKPYALKPSLLQNLKSSIIEKDEEFRDILNRFRDGETGDMCRNDKIIQLIGYRHFNLRRHEAGKENEVRKVVMSEMRELSRLYIKFKDRKPASTSAEDMFSRDNLQELVDTIQELVSKPGTMEENTNEKHGLKLFIDSIILRSIKTLQGHFSETKQDQKSKEMKMFKLAYKHRACELFPRARHTCVKNSLEKLRRPSELPHEMDLRKLNAFTQESIAKCTQNFDVSSYAWLRTLIVTRLTLFNAKRGEEASRLLLSEWEDAEKDIWLPGNEIENIHDPTEKHLVG